MEEFASVLKVVVVVGMASWLASGTPVLGQKQKKQESVAVVAGTVFHETGRSLAGVRITVTPRAESGESSKGMKPLKAVSDARGEFAIRVPAGAMRYNIKAEAKGFQIEEKEVTTSWDERVDVFFRLKPNQGEAGDSK